MAPSKLIAPAFLLLVEIKRALSPCQILDFLKVLHKTAEQACHAFATYYPGVNAFGAVIALGDCWSISVPISESSDLTFPVPLELGISDMSKT
jgi:hypothetical protein